MSPLRTSKWIRSGSLLWVTMCLHGLVGPEVMWAQEGNELAAALALEHVVVDAVAKCEKSVVAVARVREAATEAGAQLPAFLRLDRSPGPLDPDFIPNEFGAGVVVDSQGLILTTAHVVGDATEAHYYVWSQRRAHEATVLATAPWFDLAVLKVKDGGEWTPVIFGDGAQVQRGQFVLSAGNPFAIARDGQASISWGIIANLARPAPRVPTRSADQSGRDTLHHFGTLIQTDTRLNTGHSGGALLNLRGEMIGLTTAYTAAPSFDSAAGYAIPVDQAFQRVVESLKKGESPAFGFLGVGPTSLDESWRERGLHGARVVSVVADTPAARADVRIDDVITHLDGQPLADENDLFRRVSERHPDAQVVLRLLRGDLTQPNTATIETTVTLTKKNVDTARRAIATVLPPAWRGVRVAYATAAPHFSRTVQLVPGDSLYVAEVAVDSPAAMAGVRLGDHITHVGERKVTTPAEFAAAVADRHDAVVLQVAAEGGRTVERTVSAPE